MRLLLLWLGLLLSSCSSGKAPIKMDVYFTPTFDQDKGDQAFVCGYLGSEKALYCYDLREFLEDLEKRKSAQGRVHI